MARLAGRRDSSVVYCSSYGSSFSYRHSAFYRPIGKALILESANILAADRVLISRQPPPEAILDYAESLGLRTARVLSFTSMAFSESGNMLVAAKAVSSDYPLRVK